MLGKMKTKLAEQMIKENRYGTTVFMKRPVNQALVVDEICSITIFQDSKYFHVKEG